MTSPYAIIDVDGVVADFTDHLLQAVSAKLTLQDITDWDIFRFMSEHEKKHAHHVLEQPSFWISQPVIDGAKEGIQRIRDDGYTVIWCTSPWVSCTSWASVRRAWLKQHFAAAHDEVVVSARKDLLRGDLFIDDKPQHVFSWEAMNGTGSYLFNAPYNQSHDWPRLDGWADIERVLDERRAVVRV